MPRLVCISDTHSLHRQVDIPKGDILIHCGDIGNVSDLAEMSDFCSWINDLDFQRAIVIAGNHDFFLEDNELLFSDMLGKHIRYLRDSYITIDGLKFYGLPHTNRFMDWAFMLEKENMQRVCDIIPDDIDVIISHGPIYGFLDEHPQYQNSLGSKELLAAVARVSPKLLVHGHIHSGYGIKKFNDNTTLINCSICDENYDPINKPIVIDI
jgi:Icc-related predicted phosphoesterase